MLREYHLDTPQGTLNIARGPANGPVLLLLPGFTNRWQTYLPILPALLPDWQVLTFDYSGHGRSARRTGAYSAAAFYADAREVLLSLGVDEPALLFGHSMGGSLALHLAQDYPEKVRAVVTGDTSFNLSIHIDVMNNRRSVKLIGLRRKLAGRPVDELMRRGLPSAQAEETAQLDPRVMDFHAEGRVAEFFGQAPGQPPEEAIRDVDFGRITCPLFLTQANPARGGLLQDAEISAVLAAYPRIHFMRFDCGHDMEIDQGIGSPFFRAALDFLNQVGRL